MTIELATSEQVRGARAVLGMSVVDFAEAVGVSAHTVYAWEEGARSPKPTAVKLMRMLVEEKEANG